MSTNKTNEMSFLEHLEVLRWHLVRSFLAIIILAILAFIYKNIVFDIIIFGPSDPNFLTNRLLCALSEKLDIPSLCINNHTIAFQNITMSGQFTTHIKISFLAGLIAAFPYIFWEFWSFIRPALSPDEKKNSRGAIFAATVLFSIGIMFAYYLICPLSIQFLTNYTVSDKVDNILNLGSYISTISSIILAGGVIFELPIITYFLAKVGIVNAEILKKYRRHAIVGSLLLAAIITPPDIISQILVCLPLILLYEGGIIIAKRIAKRKAKAQ